MSEISASIEETNALRAKLGLKPLKVGPESSSAQIAEDNLKRQREEEAKKAHEEEVKKRIQKAKNKRQLNKVVAGKGLGEASDDDDTDDVHKWTMKSRQSEKKRQAEAAARRERELQELDEAYQADYDESHLSGLRVGHDVSDFAEGEEKILTLKDSTILENEEHGDELINVQMSEKQRLDKNLENKKKVNRPVYSGYDDEEFVLGKKKNILSQYDEVLGIEDEGEGFVIGRNKSSQRSVAGQEGADSQSRRELSAKEIMNQKLKESAIALSYNKTQQIQDYYTKEEAEVTFKKFKKKKKSRSRKTDNWDNEEVQEEDSMEVDKPAPVDFSDMNFVDDEDLQESLAKARRIATKKTIKKLTPEQIAKNLAESNSMEVGDDEEMKGGLIISDVSEFVSNLSSSAVQIPSSRATASAREKDSTAHESVRSPTDQDAPKEDMEMEDSKDRETPVNSYSSLTRAESEDEGDVDVPMNEATNDESTAAATGAPVLVEEPLVSSGLGATLALLKQKGAYETGSAEHVERSKNQSDRAKWLAEAKLREVKLARELADQKARDRERAKDKNYSTRDRDREREYENQRREQQLLDEREARMKNYKPDIKLEYIDEGGNRLSTKEAFRQLSHAFHGKSSGKMKTEKRMKKLEDEKRLLGMSSTDTPLNMVTALQERQKAAGAAHIVLAVGNRNVVPSRLANTGASGTATPIASSSRSGTASTSTAPSASTSTFAAPSTTTQPTMSVSGVHAPNREKVTFGLKRKADTASASGPTEESAPKKSRT
ncbi:hypothetical protein BGW38_002224 [Lunasporangiospora selenospora]|uniref:SART-1 protein n=1 Tax=Lunasporangiospora selenospora TaxID=979761 RepID=A0A9P6FSD2_9FUNG|nr:hypothetical protein BGW38_002224 [Lunasporangiospora selenospora]